MKPFAYASPRSLADAVALLAADGTMDGGVRPLAGGTDLLPLLKADLAAPERLIDIKRLADLDDRIEDGPDGLTIGALATLAEIEDDPLVRAVAPALTDAAALAATPQLRNMATLGGNLLQRPRCWYFRNQRIPCWLKGGSDCPARPGENQLHAVFDVSPCVAVHPSDPAVALLALDAVVQMRGADGTREMPLAEFFAAPTADRRVETILAPDELIVSIRIPPPAGPRRSVYHKAMERNVWAFALVSVAAAVRMESGRIADCRLALGGVAPIPWRAKPAERLLTGATPTAATIAAAADAALAGASPLAHNGYKLPLARALIRRALSEVTTPAPA